MNNEIIRGLCSSIQIIKNKNMKSNFISAVFATMLMLLIGFTPSNTFAQTKTGHSKMKDCCMMKEGKMMCMIGGKEMPMDKDMTMKDGTTCMVNGECVMKDGTKMQMKDGQCMDMNGKMGECAMMTKHKKSSKVKKHSVKQMP